MAGGSFDVNVAVSESDSHSASARSDKIEEAVAGYVFPIGIGTANPVISGTG